MRKLWIVFLTIALGLTSSAQNNQVVAGKSFGPLQLGMNENEILDLLGEPAAIRSFQEEQKQQISFGKNIWKELRYNTHYDKVLEYKSTSLPVRKAYFKEGSLVYVTLTTFGYDNDLLNRFKISSLLDFDSREKNIIAHYGYAELTEDYTHVKQLYYLNQGIDFMLQDGKIIALNIYDPIDKEVALAIKAKTGH